ncbi:MAG: fepC, partial [Sporomusa sp.]|nr:fepC [Sporomusa sp.]
QLLSIVKSLGIGVLAALHDLSLAAMYCDKLYVMKDGAIVTYGPPNKIITPQLIRDVYEIDCTIQKNSATGYLAISYHPCHCSA